MRFSLRAALLGGGPGEGLPSPGKASTNKKSPSVSNVLLSYDRAHTVRGGAGEPLGNLELSQNVHSHILYTTLVTILCRPASKECASG